MKQNLTNPTKFIISNRSDFFD